MDFYTFYGDFNGAADKIAALPHGLVVINGPKSFAKTRLVSLIESALSGNIEGECARLVLPNLVPVGWFGLVDTAGPATHWVGSLRDTFRSVAEFGFRAFMIEDLGAWEDTEPLIEKSIDLALTGTLVVISVDGTSTPEGKNAVDTIREKASKFPEYITLWIDLPNECNLT